MTPIQPTLNPLLSPTMLDRMHGAALGVLARTGLQISLPELAGQITGRPGVSVRDGRICFQESLVEALVQRIRRQRQANAAPAGGRILIGAGGHAHHVLDMDSDAIRPLAARDLTDMAKLVDALYDDGVRGGAPGVPQDTHMFLRPLLQYKTACDVCRHGRGHADLPSLSVVDELVEMKKVMGDANTLSMHILSPLRLEGNEFELYFHFQQKKIPVASIYIGSMPMIGVTAPIHPVGGFVQAIAEGLGALALMSLLTEGQNVALDFYVHAYPFDMKTASIVYGSPEHNLIDLMQLEINRYYGHPGPGGRFIRTMAKRPGVQSAAEMTASAVAGALGGATSFSGGGLMSLDEVFSPEQLIIACEVRDYAERIRRGFEFSEDALAESIIDQVTREGGDFAGHGSTLDHFRKIYWDPALFDRRMLGQWQQQPGPDVREKARAIAKKKISEHTYELDATRRRELDKLYERAKEKVRG